MFRRFLSLMLAAVMVLGLIPAQVFATQSIALPEAEHSDGLQNSGRFYLGSTQGELLEAESGWYLLRVARGGESLDAAELRLELLDITANYGEDYKVSLSGGLLGPRVENGAESTSLMDQIQEEGVQEDLQQDVALVGMSDEQIQEALQEQTDGLGEVLSQELGDYAREHPDRYIHEYEGGVGTETALEPAADATVRENPERVPLDDDEDTPTGLSAAYEAQTGRKDDWQALSSDGTSILDTSSLMMDYSMDAADAISQGLNSAYLDIAFQEGETEKTVMLRTVDNGQGQGDRLFMARLTAVSEDVQVDGEFSRCMLTIVDDEDWEEPTVSFSQGSYDAKNGFVDVTIRREGILTPVSTVHLITSDGTAVNGRDYSQVDADVAFPFGVSERVIHIPVRSTFLAEGGEFSLTLTKGVNCALGEADSAQGVIAADSESFEMPASETEEEAELMVYSGGIRYGEAIDLSKWTKTGVTYGSGSVWMDGNKCMIKADSGGLNDDRAWTYADWNILKNIRMDGNIKALTGYSACGIEYNGISIKSTRTDDGKPTSYLKMWAADDWYQKDTIFLAKETGIGTDYGSWSSTEHRFYCDDASRSKQGVSSLRIWNSKADGAWRKNSTLSVEEIRPILRPFIVTAEIANPEALRYVDNQGNLVDYKAHDSAKSAGELTLGGANTGENTVVKFVGDSIEVSCTGEYSYIQKIQLTNSSGNSYTVTPTYKVGNKTASFALDTSALRYLHNRNLITFSKNPDGDGYVGNLKLQVVMGKIPTTVTLNNSDQRGQVALGFDLHNGRDNGTKKAGDDRNYSKVYRGDYVRFTEDLDDSYKDAFTASTIRIKRERQTNSGEAGMNNGGYEIFDGNQSAWQVTMLNEYAALTAWPSFQDIDNHIVVRVADKDKALFDTSGGIFEAKTIPGETGYTDYEVIGQAAFAAHTFYTLAATPRDPDSVAVWTPGNSRDSYSQNTYYHEGSAEKGSNVIVLTCQKAEPTPFALTGDAYYAALDLRTGVEGATWMPADGLTVTVTPAAYAISDTDGKFTSVPFKGVAGCQVVMRTEAMGNVNYKTARLSKGMVRQVGTDTAAVNAYMVPLGTSVVPVVNPGVASIQAASLSDSMGVALRTAAVYSDVIEAQKHRYTFTATVVHDGVEYTDTDGTVRTEHVERVEFLAFDPSDNTERGTLPGEVTVTDNGDGSKTFSLSLGLDMTEDNLNIYRPGDKVYVRLTTDRVRGNGKSLDADGNQVENPTLQETVYAPVYTGYDLVSAAAYIPPELNIKVLDGNMDDIFDQLPVFGSLNCTLRFNKLMVSEQALPNGGISLCIGYRLNADNDLVQKEFDGEFDGIKDAASKMMEWGKIMKTPPPMVVGVGNAGVSPFVGLYLDFGVDRSQDIASSSLTFIGGGLYVGCTGFFQAVFYFPVGPIPVYFGAEGDLTGYVNLGIQIPENAMTISELQNADLDGMLDLDFKLKVQAAMRLYVGVGLAGTLGVRGGLEFNMAYLYYPSVKNINPAYREHGFTIDLNLKIWADAYFFSVPIPAMSLVHEAYGYAADIENGGPKASLTAEDSGPVTRRAPTSTAWLAGEAALQSTLEPTFLTELIGDNYPYADPQLLDTGEALILVFLTTEALFGTSEKGRGDESTLAYSIYPYTKQNPAWCSPKRLGAGDTMLTGDFQPNVTLLSDRSGGEVLVSWVSRKNTAWAEDPENPTTEERIAYLSQMEVYSVFCDLDGDELKVLGCQQVTDDDYYNSEPLAVWSDMGAEGDRTILFYQAAEPGVKDIAEDDPVYRDFRNEESRQLLANVSPSQNGSFLVYKTFDADAGGWKGKADAGTFVATPVNGQNRPVITDFTVQSYPYPTPAGDGMNYWALFAYTVDGDGNMSTPYDTELYLQLYDMLRDRTYDPIRLTDDATVAVSRPQFTEPRQFDCNLFWYEAPDTSREEHAYGKKNGQIRMLELRELFLYGLDIDTAKGSCALKETISLEEMRELYPDAFDALEEKEELPTSFPYSIHIKTVNMPESDEFEDGPTVASFIPYVDSMGEIHVIWLQTMTHEMEAADGTVQKVQTNEIYASALISDEDVSRESNLWSIPVRLTDDEKFYDEAAMVHLWANNQLYMAANRYEFALQDAGDSAAKPVESADLVLVEFSRAGSVEAVDIRYEPEMPVAGETVRATVTLRNTGLLTAKSGARYYVFPLIGGEQGSLLTEGSFETKLLPGDTEEITFDYTLPEDLSGVEQIGFAVQSEETGFVTVSETRFTGEDAIQVGWRAELCDVQTEERDDGFYVTCQVTNTGNLALPAGAVQLMAGDNSAMSNVWATQQIDTELAPGEISDYTLKLEQIPDAFSAGFQRGFLTLADTDGNALEDIGCSRDLILTLSAPYNLVVNEDPDLPSKGITCRAGQTLTLSGTYAGESYYPDGAVLFATEDSQVAAAMDGRLYALEEGETVLIAKTAPCGEAIRIPVTVTAGSAFRDVPEDAYYADAVDWAVKSGITAGTSRDTFSPKTPCTRAQMVAFLWRAAGRPEPVAGDTDFTDVAEDAYYYKAVLWAVENGITYGVSKTAFAPDSTVTRAQTVTFLYRFAHGSATGSSSFVDVPADKWYAKAVAWAEENRITSGVDKTHFAPENDCVRAQIVAFLYRLLGK